MGQRKESEIRHSASMKTFFRILIVCILIVIPASGLNAQGAKENSRIFFEDYFYDDTNKWALVDTQSAQSKIEKGKYIIENRMSQGEYLALHSLDLSEKLDFAIEASIENLNAVQSPGYGLFWGSLDEIGYIFRIHDNGFYSFEKVEKRVAASIKKNKARDRWDLINTIKIIKQGNFIRFYINSKYIDEVESSDPFFTKKVGFIIDNNQKIAVDYIRVSEIVSAKISAEEKTLEPQKDIQAETIEQPARDAAEDDVKTKELKETPEDVRVSETVPEEIIPEEKTPELREDIQAETIEQFARDAAEETDESEEKRKEESELQREAKDDVMEDSEESRLQQFRDKQYFTEDAEEPDSGSALRRSEIYFTLDELAEYRAENGLKNLEPHSIALINAGIKAYKEKNKEKAVLFFEKAKELSPDLPLPYLHLIKMQFSSLPKGFVRASGYLMEAERAFINNFWWSFQTAGMLSISLVTSFYLTFLVFLVLLIFSKSKLYVHDIVEDKRKILLMLPAVIFIFFGPIFGILGLVLPFWVYYHKKEKITIYISISITLFIVIMLPWLYALPGALQDNTLMNVVTANEGKPSGDIIKAVNGDQNYENAFAHALDLKRRGDYHGAARIYENLLKQKEDSRIYNNLANCYVGLNEFDKALYFYNRALQLQVIASTYYNLSQISREKFYFTKADEFYLKAVEEDPLKVASYNKIRGASVNRLVMDETYNNKELWLITLNRSQDYESSNLIRNMISFTNRISSVTLLCFFIIIFILHKKYISSGAYRCIRCGIVHCNRCEKKISRENICHRCSQVLVKTGELTPQERIRRILEAKSFKRNRNRIIKILTLIFPGSGHVFYGWSVQGFLIMLAFSFFVLSVFFWSYIPVHLSMDRVSSVFRLVSFLGLIFIYVRTVINIFRRVP
jgi:tetratricopeptide (TPR) repeat protein